MVSITIIVLPTPSARHAWVTRVFSIYPTWSKLVKNTCRSINFENTCAVLRHVPKSVIVKAIKHIGFRSKFRAKIVGIWVCRGLIREAIGTIVNSHKLWG